MTDATKLHPAAEQTLQRWHAMIEQVDLADVADLLHPDVVFRSPAAHKPYPTAETTAHILQTVMQVFEGFTYHRQLVSADGHNVVLEFRTQVGDKALHGIDMIRFDADGKMVEFEVMIRPLSGLQTLAEVLAKRLGPYLAERAAVLGKD